MAKVMISMPDELVASVDREAQRLGTTRSGLLRTYAEDALRRRNEERARRIEEVMRDATGHGGNGLAELKRLRRR